MNIVMKNHFNVFLGFFLFLFGYVSWNTPINALTRNGNTYTSDEANNVNIFQSAHESVVFVTNTQLYQNFFSLNVEEIPSGSGTGFIWSKKGYIVTNYHVIQGASKITITLADHSAWEAKIIGVAPDKDIAVLQINPPIEKLIPLPIGDSSTLEVGRKVLAIGNPFGLDQTLTVGVISALGREINSVSNRKIKGVIQTDAAINPGNSGGPLLNSSGELVGVNTAIYSPSGASSGIGFAIPVNTVKKIVPQLIQYGKVIRPTLGVNIAADSIAYKYDIKGVIIVDVLEGTPAYRAGLKGITKGRGGRFFLGDVIYQINDKSIKNSDDLLSILESHKVGDLITIKTKRNGKTKIFRVNLISSQ